MKAKNKLVVQIKKEAKNVVLILGETYQKRKRLLKWILQNISEKQTFQRTAKFIVSGFSEIDVMKRIAIIIKVDEMFNF